MLCRNNKLHSFAFYLLVTTSSVCKKALPPKSTRLAVAAAAKRAWWQQWLWWRWTTEVKGTARAAVGRRGQWGRQGYARRVRCHRWRRQQWQWQARADTDGQGTRAGGDDNSRQGQTLTGKGWEPARRRRQARALTGKRQEPAWWRTTTALSL
jgi:hypothetical protein